MPTVTVTERVHAAAQALRALIALVPRTSAPESKLGRKPAWDNGTPAFDNRPTWANNTPAFDNRPTWDNWNKKK